MADTLDLRPQPAPVTTPAGDRLLDAAEALFYWRGIGAVGVDLIADTAGVTKRTLYQRFGSKSDLVRAYLGRRAHRWQTRLLDALEPLAPSERVLAVYDVAAAWSRTNPRGCAFVNAWAELEHADDPAARLVREEKQWMRDLFRALVDDEAVADRLHLLYEGAHVVGSTLADPQAQVTAREAAAAMLGAAVRSRTA